MQSKQKQQSVGDDGMLGAETVRRRLGEPTSKLAADSTLSPKVNYTHSCLLFVNCVYVAF